MKVKTPTDNETAISAIENGTVFVYYGAPWSISSNSHKSGFYAVAGRFADKATFVDINIDSCPKAPRAIDLLVIPAVVVYKDGEIEDATFDADLPGIGNFVESHL